MAEISSSSKPKAGFYSAAVWSFALFAAVNTACFRALHNTADKNGMSIVVDKFISQSDHPNAVILGSSVAKHICDSIDQSDLNRLKISPLSYNLQTVTDGYVLTDKFLAGRRQPNTVVYCVCPRDFVDNDEPDLIRSTTFRRLVSPADLISIAPKVKLSIADAGRAAFDYVCALYDARASFQKRASDWFASCVGETRSSEKIPTNYDAFWQRSLKEYTWRYKDISDEKIQAQMQVLKNSLLLCRSRGVEAIIVNAPLTQDNLRLLPKGVYSNYVKHLQDLSIELNVELVNFAGSNDLVAADYDDCAHVSKTGGKKVFAKVEPFLSSRRDFAQTQRRDL